EVPIGQGVTGMAALTREVQIGTPSYGGIHIDRPEAPKWVMAAPMLVGDDLVGVLTAVTYRTDKRFSREDALLYAGVAWVAAVVVGQRREIDAVQSLHRSPEMDNLSTPLSEHEELERSIVTSVARLVKRSPDQLRPIASMLAAIEKLCEQTS